MLNSKNTEQTFLQLDWYKAQSEKQSFVLKKKKLLVGSGENCDIRIDDPTVSSYHAFIFIEEDGGKILDLQSENGVTINAEDVKESYFSSGDQLSLGEAALVVQETIQKKSTKDPIFENPDKDIKRADREQAQAVPPKPDIEGLTLIDGEYCDIIFDQHNYRPTGRNPLEEIRVDYVDSSEEELETFIGEKSSEEDAHDGAIESTPPKNKVIEVSIFSMGVLIDHTVLPLKEGKYTFSTQIKNNQTVQLEALDTEQDLPFLESREGRFKFLPIEGMEAINSSKEDKENPSITYQYGTFEIFVTVKKAPPKLRGAPLFRFERGIKQSSAKVFSGLISFMLLLLLIPTTEEVKKKKEVAVIYKPAQVKGEKTTKKKSENPAEKEKDQGVQKKKHKKEKAKMAKSAPKKPTPEKKTERSKKPKKTVKAQKKPVKKKAPAKKRKFNIAASGKMKKLFQKNKKVQVESKTAQNSQNANSVSKASTSTATASTSQSQTEIDSLGSNNHGESSDSAGARGLASKQGASSAYMEPKTVVLGSMDPELLRKLLREYLPQFRHCYQRELDRQDKKLKGVLDLNFHIKGDGAVANINIQLRQAQFTSNGVDCMGNVLKMIPFPKPKGGGVVEVKQPLNFFAQKQKI